MTLVDLTRIPTRHSRSWRRLFFASWALPMPIWLGLFFVAPFVLLVTISFWRVRNFRLQPDFTLDAWQRVFGAEFFWESLIRSTVLAGSAAIILTVLAFPMSYAIAFVLDRDRRLTVLGLLIVPFFTSYLVRIYSWQMFLSEQGLFGTVAEYLGFQNASALNSILALMVGYGTLALPVVVILQTISLLSIDRVLIDAAYNLRCRPARTVTSVIVPAAKPGLVLGALFAFILTFGDFVTPLYLGGGTYTTLPILITDTVRSGQQWPRAAVVSIAMIITLLFAGLAALRLAYHRKD
jgi:ABC-type spermidine/putrescine transport system permease subunit I